MAIVTALLAGNSREHVYKLIHEWRLIVEAVR